MTWIKQDGKLLQKKDVYSAVYAAGFALPFSLEPRSTSAKNLGLVVRIRFPVGPEIIGCYFFLLQIIFQFSSSESVSESYLSTPEKANLSTRIA